MFEDYLNHRAKQLATNACYLVETIAAINSYEYSLNDAVYAHQFARYFIENFDHYGEKFYPLFFGSVSDDNIVFKNLSKKCLVILGV